MSPYRALRKLGGKIVRAIPWIRQRFNVSCDYKVISSEKAATIRADGWMSSQTARWQRRACNQLLAVYNGVGLMRVFDYCKAIAESCRVTGPAAIFHSSHAEIFDCRPAGTPP